MWSSLSSVRKRRVILNRPFRSDELSVFPYTHAMKPKFEQQSIFASILYPSSQQLQLQPRQPAALANITPMTKFARNRFQSDPLLPVEKSLSGSLLVRSCGRHGKISRQDALLKVRESTSHLRLRRVVNLTNLF